MSDIKLAINIPEEIMEYINNNGCLSVIYNDEVAKAIINGMPVSTKGDLISRSALKNELEVTPYNDIDDLTRTERLIDNALAVDAYPFERVQELVKLNQQFAQEIVNLTRPTGKWIPMEVSSGRDSWKCSICGRRARGKLNNLPFCHCGAKMKGGEKE